MSGRLACHCCFGAHSFWSCGQMNSNSSVLDDSWPRHKNPCCPREICCNTAEQNTGYKLQSKTMQLGSIHVMRVPVKAAHSINPSSYVFGLECLINVLFKTFFEKACMCNHKDQHTDQSSTPPLVCPI